MSTEPSPAKRPWLAGLLAVVQPGLGHLYAGETRRAVAILAAAYLAAPVLWLTRAAAYPSAVALALAATAIFVVWAVRDAVLASRRGAGRYFRGWWIYALVTVVLLPLQGAAAAIGARSVRAFSIPGNSMTPTLRPGDRLMADMRYPGDDTPQRGDVVIVEGDDHTVQVKRVIALSNERVSLRDKRVFVDGQPLKPDWGQHLDPRVYAPGAGAAGQRDNMGEVLVPHGYVFLLGDNRDNSYDCRFYGPLPLSALRGRALYLYWSRDLRRIGSPIH